jgi:N-hydroxyarylamine O-acetyltransferase
VLAKLGLPNRPALDLAGLNRLYAAVCGSIPFDNVQKRIWFAGDRTKPATGGDPVEFFENWVKHGTGGTCWPANGGMYALAHALGFNTRRIVGSVIVPNYPQGANHGSVLIMLDGVEYVFDLAFGAFKVVPLISGKATAAGTGIHNMEVVPVDGGFEMFFHLGWTTDTLPFRPESEHDPVDHEFFISRYDRANHVGFFNDTLMISRRFADSIVTIGRGHKLVLTSDGLTKTELSSPQRDELLIEELGLSPEVVSMIPPDVEGGVAPF